MDDRRNVVGLGSALGGAMKHPLSLLAARIAFTGCGLRSAIASPLQEIARSLHTSAPNRILFHDRRTAHDPKLRKMEPATWAPIASGLAWRSRAIVPPAMRSTAIRW